MTTRPGPFLPPVFLSSFFRNATSRAACWICCRDWGFWVLDFTFPEAMGCFCTSLLPFLALSAEACCSLWSLLACSF